MAEPEFRTALGTSFILHGVIFLALIFGLPHMRPPPIEIIQPIAIDIVDVGPVTTTQQQGQGQVAKENNLAPAPLPPKPQAAPPPKPAAKPTPPPQQQTQPVKPKPAPQPQVNDKDALSNLIKSESKKAKARPQPDKKDDTQQQFGSLLKNLSKQKPPPSTADAKAPPAPAAPQAASGASGIVSGKLTMSEEDALRAQIGRCWVPPVGAKDAQNLIIELHLEVNPDRTVKTVDIVDNGRMDDPFYRAAAESARRAVLNPNCSPLNLPEGKQDLWGSTTLRFSPQDMP